MLLSSGFEALAQKLHCPILLGIPGATNASSRRAFEKLGWIEYSVPRTWQNFTVQHIYKDVPTSFLFRRKDQTLLCAQTKMAMLVELFLE